MPITNDIRAALDSKLASLSGLPPVVFTNQDFDENAGDDYISVSFSLTSRRPAVRGPNPQMRYQGLYTVTVCVPTDIGAGRAIGHVDKIMGAFDGSTDVVGPSKTVSIEYAEPGAAFYRGAFYCMPVQIAWYIYDF